MEDRRLFERIAAQFSVRLLNPADGSEADGLTFDISANGLGLSADRTFQQGTPVEMWLAIPDQHAPLYCRGEVVWSESAGGAARQRMGVSLDKAELMGLARILWMRRAS